eukprot:15352150-Ditylum_brightwellii.AAC.1
MEEEGGPFGWNCQCRKRVVLFSAFIVGPSRGCEFGVYSLIQVRQVLQGCVLSQEGYTDGDLVGFQIAKNNVTQLPWLCQFLEPYGIPK